MINSRWPRPIGIKASIAFRPVAIGSLTDLRGMMPGALTSTRMRLSAWIGPLPSMGLPGASATGPGRPLPTGGATVGGGERAVGASLYFAVARTIPHRDFLV